MERTDSSAAGEGGSADGGARSVTGSGSDSGIVPLERTWSVLLLVVVVSVVMAGCTGLGGDGGGSDDTDTPGDDGGIFDATPTPTATETPTATATASATVSATATATASATASPASTPAETESEASMIQSWSPEDHSEALEEAGSFTLEYTGRFDSGSGASIVATERVDLDSGERFSSLTSITSKGNFTTEYYVPPGSDTAFRYDVEFNRTREQAATEANVANFTNLGTTGVWPETNRSGVEETELGPATVFVADEVSQLDEETRDAYEEVESVEMRIYVDNDTGAIAKYDYRITYVEDGSEQSSHITFELLDIGSTTVEEPGWVPEE